MGTDFFLSFLGFLQMEICKKRGELNFLWLSENKAEIVQISLNVSPTVEGFHGSSDTLDLFFFCIFEQERVSYRPFFEKIMATQRCLVAMKSRLDLKWIFELPTAGFLSLSND